MAKYEDYVKTDEIDGEIEQAAAATEERKLEGVPESVISRFEGKDVEEVLRSYAELEKAYSKQGQKHGELRKSFDEFIALQSQASVASSEPEPEAEPITADDLYEDPETAVSRIVDKATGNRIKKLEESLEQTVVEKRLNRLNEQFGNWQETVASEEFSEWIQEKPYRAKLAQQANAFDFDAAEEILGMYADLRGAKQEASQDEEVSRQKALEDAQLETATPEAPVSDEVISRTFIIQTKLAAKQGNQEARAWLASNKGEIERAYAEGRVVD